MKKIWFLTYNILFLPIFWIVINFFSFFNKKIRKGILERRNLFESLDIALKSFDKDRDNIIIHCSSLGEFEQAKPVFEELDKTDRFNFVISFFSPSGFHHAKFDSNIKSPIIKTYLPFDSMPNVNRFISAINPKAVIFIKYDLWLNLLNKLKSEGIFRLLINATYNEKSFKWKFFISRSYRKTVHDYFNVISTSEEDDKIELEKVLSPKVKIVVSGDTKLERIEKAKESSKNRTLLNGSIIGNKKVLVVGSSWDSDMDILLPVIDKINCNKKSGEKALISIIAPHEPNEHTLLGIEEKIKDEYNNLRVIRYSNIEKFKNENLILIDSIGLLLILYKYADIAYVGGGWRSGIHNVMEPAGYGIPVLFGNEKLTEDAELLIETGGGVAVGDKRSLYRNLLHLLTDMDERIRMGARSQSVFLNNQGTSKKISRLLMQNINREREISV
ncbi:MAG: hypothetical protein EHM58_17985 [Ignavibacteriae bacterium]|nr:MAG: hypothetical protein EHM58_17985 [Ignavibacteriota bacterium]